MYKNSKHAIIFPLLLAIGVVLGILLGQFVGRNRAETQLRTLISRSGMNMTNKIMQTSMLIEHRFVDSISMDSLSELVIPMMMEKLDPHSVYIPAREMQELNEPLEGEFDGVGISFNTTSDTIMVLSVIANGPSAKAGVVAGDRIIEINDTLVAGVGMPQNDIVKRLRGKRGSEVKLSLKRQGIDDLVDVMVVRDAIPIKSIEASFMLTDEIGFIRLSQFARTSYVELMAALARLRAEGMKRLIFDLRDNSGGFLDQAIMIANEFLPAGKLIVYTEDRQREQTREYSDGSGSSTDLALVILIDEGSASSSEILAGAVQDNDRGTIIGRRSFGKGLVQQQIPFADGSAIRLTVARYYTPSGRSIQKPYKMGEGEDYAMDLLERFEHGEFYSADSVQIADSTVYYTKKGRIVRGGGGIMPDIFIPLDTLGVTAYYTKVWNMNVLYRYTLDFTDRHRKDIDAIKSLAELDSMFERYNLVEDFVAYAERHGVKRNPRDIATSRSIISAQLRAYIGRNTPLSDAAFYYNIYPNDKVLQRAVEEIKKKRK